MTPWQLEVFSVSIRKQVKWSWVKQQVKITGPQETCLDVGTGVGTLGYVQEQLGGIWEFTETDSESAREARRILRGPVHEIDIFDPTLQPTHYNLLTIFDVIEHVPDPAKFLARAADLLIPGGVLILTTPADDSKFYFWRRLAEKLFRINKAAHGHVVEGFSRQQLEKLTHQAGLKLDRLDSFSLFFTEMIELAYNGAYTLKNHARQKTSGYNLALSPASAHDVSRHRLEFHILKIIHPFLRAISLLDSLIPKKRGYEWGLVAHKP